MKKQQTLNEPVEFSGIGLHTGCRIEMAISPAPDNHGIVFRRTDLEKFPIEATAENIANVSYATTLMKKGVLISTVEHVLSALYGLAIDNACIDVSNIEVPIMDGSADPFCERILDVGLHEQNAFRKSIKITKPLHHILGDKTIDVSPSDTFKIQYSIDFQHPLIGNQVAEYDITPDVYRNQLASARTFGFLRDIEHLKENGLIKGGSLENAVVLSEDRVINSEGLRFPDEFVRHKIMDFLGDISLLGMPVIGSFTASKAGHGLHASIVKKILSDHDNYSIVTHQAFSRASVV